MPNQIPWSIFALCIALLANISGPSSASGTPRNGVHETALKSSKTYGNPFVEAEVKVQFISPTGHGTTVYAFYDGGDTWRVRFSPTETGTWRWKSECSDKQNTGLHGRTGQFECTAYKGKNALLTHGPLKLSANRRYMVHADGTPFFWLADTAWNGVLKAKPEDWDRYLSIRKSQGFTAVHFVSTQWRALDKDPHGETAFTGSENIRINPAFFQRMDGKVAAINEHGLVASPVILWANHPSDPGQCLPEQDTIRLARYITARWGAYNVVWTLAGDGRYDGDRAERWRRIGRAVFGDKPLRPATMHPCGLAWVADEFRHEPWFSFIGYQSGHGDSPYAIRWLVQGPPASEWGKSPAHPVINLEPNYEAHISYDFHKPFDAHLVRVALYRSLLVSPTAGVTYGHHGIWPWPEKAEVPLNHWDTGMAPPWHEAVHAEGAESVRHLKEFFSTIPWWKLIPDPKLVVNQPSDPHQFIASARTDDGSLAVIYLPDGGEVEVDVQALDHPSVAKWYNPGEGTYVPAGEVTGTRLRAKAPNRGDWVLLITRKN